MSDGLRFYGPVLLAWVLTAFRAADLRGHVRDPARRSVFTLMAALAASITINTPLVSDVVWRLTGVPNLARPVSHSLMLVVAWQIQSFVLIVSSPAARRPRWEAVWVSLVLAGLWVAFALTDSPDNDMQYSSRYRNTPGVLEYWLIFCGYVVPAFARAVVFALREARQTENGAVRAGLRIVAAGAACALLYHLHKAAWFLCHRIGVHYPEVLEGPLDRFLTPSAAVLTFIGLSLPAWGRPDALLGRLRLHHLHLRLRPLWRALYDANPDIALMKPASLPAELFAFSDVDLRLYRRFVEIRDGRIALQPYLDAGVGDEARREGARSGLGGKRLEAYAEAAMLDAAIRARARGLPPEVPAGQQAVPGGLDLTSDAAFLALVSRAYRRRQRRGRGVHEPRAAASS